MPESSRSLCALGGFWVCSPRFWLTQATAVCVGRFGRGVTPVLQVCCKGVTVDYHRHNLLLDRCESSDCGKIIYTGMLGSDL
jgi:hypothetical protein